MNKENNEIEISLNAMHQFALNENSNTTYNVEYEYKQLNETFTDSFKIERRNQPEKVYRYVHELYNVKLYNIKKYHQEFEKELFKNYVNKRIEMLKNICIERCPEDEDISIKSFSIEYTPECYSPTFNPTKFKSEYEMSESI